MKAIKTLIILFLFILTSCENEYPAGYVNQSNTMIVYKMEAIDSNSNEFDKGAFKYAITDNSYDGGWTYYSNDNFNVGDTIKISN